MATIRDTVLSQIPGHIIESYPRFYEFLEAYYEWLHEDGNPYQRVKDHMDYLTFEKSLDSYVEFMKHEYLTDVPDAVLFDKELFIKWSRQFNLARGSHASYKFLFRLLFNEQDMSIYVPKENILRTSDGNWIFGESLMMVTHSSTNLEDFQFQRIEQVRPIYQDIVERATAVVQRVRTKYAGRYVVTELSVSGIEGEFKENYPITAVDTGAEEWLIPTVSDVAITDEGSGYQIGQRVLINGMDEFCVEREAGQDGSFDTRVTSFFSNTDLELYINNVLQVNDFTYDGRYITSTNISENDLIKVVFPSYQGYIVIDSIDSETRGVTNIEVLDLPIGCQNTYSVTVDGSGTGLVAETVSGYVKPVQGYYEGTRGQLSSNMDLQDSYFYQNYSYAIKTSQDFTAYADIVKNVLHPAGFAVFGQLSIINLIELILTYQQVPDKIYNSSFDIAILHKYGLGANYQFIDKFKDGVSLRLYRMYHFDTRDMEFVSGEPGYNLEAYNLTRISSYEYPTLKGWMAKDSLSDYFNYIPQDYSEEDESGIQYFETGYVSERTQ